MGIPPPRRMRAKLLRCAEYRTAIPVVLTMQKPKLDQTVVDLFDTKWHASLARLRSGIVIGILEVEDITELPPPPWQWPCAS